MNYEKKRMRQNGRQTRKGCGLTYQIRIDETGRVFSKLRHVASGVTDKAFWDKRYARMHGEIDRMIKDGLLPKISFDTEAKYQC